MRSAVPRLWKTLRIGAAVLTMGFAAALPFLSTLKSYFIGDDFGLVQLFSDVAPLHFLSLFTRS